MATPERNSERDGCTRHAASPAIEGSKDQLGLSSHPRLLSAEDSESQNEDVSLDQITEEENNDAVAEETETSNS